MRQIVLDTETTGLEPVEGHRVIEVGCVEIVNRRRSGRTYHQYLRPERPVDPGAVAVHGLSDEFLLDKPRFAEVAEDLIEFLRGAELVIHNAPFDVAFLNAELARLGEAWGRLEDHCSVTDTLALARRLHPGQRNSLDALCKRYEVDNTQRERHGALLDAELLADVYLAMTGGQAALALVADQPGQAAAATAFARREGARLTVVRPTAEESAAHRERLAAIDRASGGRCVWLRVGTPAPDTRGQGPEP